MDIEELKKLVSQDESEHVEFKATTNARSLKEASEALCGFLNNSGGSVFFGITPKCSIVGQEVSDKTKKEIAESILKHFEPHAPIQVEYIDIGNSKSVIKLSIDMAHIDPPYYFNKVPYYRTQSSTQIMSPSKQQSLLEQRRWSVKSWESLPAVGFTIADLDHAEISKAIVDGVRHNRIPPDSDPKNIKEALTRLDLMESDQINNAAAVLFANQLSNKYPQCLLRLARFRGRDKREFIDNQQEYGHAFKILRAVEAFCDRHLPIASHFVDYQMQRVDEPFLPPLAIREAAINAICHRDYTINGSAINFAIYDDRIEIGSYGTLPNRITIEQLKQEHKSKPRNPKIASVFYRRSMIEQWGRGTQQIVELCVTEGHPEPEYRMETGGLTVYLYSKNPMQTAKEVAPKAKISLTSRQEQILAILSRSDGLRSKEILAKLSDSPAERTLRDDLAFLKQNGLVGSSGSTKTTIWHKKK